MAAVSAAARPLLRPRVSLKRMASRRFQSTASSSSSSSSSSSASASDAAAKARKTASEVTAKAAEGLSRVSAAAGPALSRVSAAAGPALSGAARNLTTALGRVGGRTGRVVNFVERQTPFVVYYSRVGLELAKQVFRGQKMAPPSLDVFQAYFQNAWKQVQNPAALLQSPASFLQRARKLTPAQLASGGVVAAELLGFFTVGEIIGRFKLIGYHGESPAAHH